MNRFLPDVNAILPLLDPLHVHHDSAHYWYKLNSPLQLIMCSHVENGVIRVASQPKYPNSLGTSGKVREVLQQFTQKLQTESTKHDVSLLDDGVLVNPEMLTPSRVSDLYLLAPAASNKARLATFDQRIPASAVVGGVKALELIPVISST